jgi:hypothetical protein
LETLLDLSTSGWEPKQRTFLFVSRSLFTDDTVPEDAIRNAISLGGDADTLACITGGIAETFYGGVPPDIAARSRELLDPKLIEVIRRFSSRFGLVANNPAAFDLAE